MRAQHGELQQIRALIHCGATRIFISPHQLNTLRLPHEAMHSTAHSLDSQVIAHAWDSRKSVMTVHYKEHSAPVTQPEVLVVPMTAYYLVLELPWFQTRKPEIHWATSQLTSLRTLGAQGESCRSGLIVQ